MKKYINMTFCGTETGLKEVLKESNLKMRLLEGDFSNGKACVRFKQIPSSYDLLNTYSLNIYSENMKEAVNIYDLILENKYRRIFGIKSNLSADKMFSKAEIGMEIVI